MGELTIGYFDWSPSRRCLASIAMILFAATTIEKLNAVPRQTWLNIGLGVLIFIAAIMVLRVVAKMNKIILWIVVGVVLTMVGFNWIYSRNEPKFLTPVVDKIAPFFPSGAAPSPKAKKYDQVLGR
jgi:amino acid transporter